jgi:hypothetical protein
MNWVSIFITICMLLTLGCLGQTANSPLIEPPTLTAPPIILTNQSVSLNNDNILLHLHDNYAKEYVSGVMVKDDSSTLLIDLNGTILPRVSLSLGNYTIIVQHNGENVRIPFIVDDDLYRQLESANEYTISFNGKELDYRFFALIDQNGNPLMATLSLDGKDLGVSDDKGAIVVDYTYLHPGNLTFTWYSSGQISGVWELDYTSDDMSYLFIPVPVNTEDKNTTR